MVGHALQKPEHSRAQRPGVEAIAADPIPAIGLRATGICKHIDMVEPGGWVGHRRRQNGLDSSIAQGRDEVVKPLEVELTRRRLQGCPRKFPHVHDIEMRLAHEPGVVRPTCFLAAFRAIDSAKRNG